jgi:hypothetical protein
MHRLRLDPAGAAFSGTGGDARVTAGLPLVGGRVQRLAVALLDRCEVALFAVRLPRRGSPGETVHVVLATGMGVGVVDKEGRARLRDVMHGAASPAQAQWRRRLEGARIVGVGPEGMELAGDGECWYATAQTTRAPECGTLERSGARIVEELACAGVDGRREALRLALVKALARLDRRIAAVQGDLSRMQAAHAAAEQARLFVAPAAQAPRGTTVLEAVDWSSGEPRRIEMPLEPARSAKEQLEAVFKRARRLKEGARVSRARLADAKQTHVSLATIAAALAARQDVDLDMLDAQARKIAPRDFRLEPGRLLPSAARPRKQPPRPPYRTFLGLSDARILVGRGAEHNDELTFHVARAHDLWLHAKNHAGAHVVVQLDKRKVCPADVLVQAAHLAVHFSDARDERLVEVQYAARRYLRKPRGSAPGFVVVEREKVIVLRREEDLLRRMLEREVLW